MANKEVNRVSRVAEMIQKELATIIVMEMKDPRVGMLTITHVELSRDYSIAKIFVTLLNDTDTEVEASLKVLNKAKAFLRTALAKKLNLRTTPELRFMHDRQALETRRLVNLIDTL